jgi:hypothetical protein
MSFLNSQTIKTPLQQMEINNNIAREIANKFNTVEDYNKHLRTNNRSRNHIQRSENSRPEYKKDFNNYVTKFKDIFLIDQYKDFIFNNPLWKNEINKKNQSYLIIKKNKIKFKK